MPTGKVKWLVSSHGYGYIEIEGGKDAFVDLSDVNGDGHRGLREGDSVEFNLEEDARGLRAADVRVIQSLSPRTR